MKKKLLAMLLVCVMVLSLMPVSALAASSYTVPEGGPLAGTVYTLVLKDFTVGQFKDEYAQVTIQGPNDEEATSYKAACTIEYNSETYYAGDVPEGAKTFNELPASTSAYTVQCEKYYTEGPGWVSLWNNEVLDAELTVSKHTLNENNTTVSMQKSFEVGTAGVEPTATADVTDPAYDGEIDYLFKKTDWPDTDLYWCDWVGSAALADVGTGTYQLIAIFPETAYYERYVSEPVNFEVSLKTIKAELSMNETVPVGTTNYNVQVSNVTDPVGYVVDGNVNYAYKGGSVENYTAFDPSKPLPAGKYTLRAVLKAGESYPAYKNTSYTANFEVVKYTLDASNTTVSMQGFTVGTTDITPTAQVTANLAPQYDGTITYEYKKTEDETWTEWTDETKSEDLTVGDYQLRAIFQETDYYTGYTSESVTFTVSELTPIDADVTMSPTMTVGGQGYSMTPTYTDPAASYVTTSYFYRVAGSEDEFQAFTWDVLRTLTAGEYEIKVVFTPKNIEGYQSHEVVKTLTVQPLSLEGKVTVGLDSFTVGTENIDPTVTFDENLPFAYDETPKFEYKTANTEDETWTAWTNSKDLAVGEYQLRATFPETGYYAEYTYAPVTFNVSNPEDITADVTMSDITKGDSAYSLNVSVSKPSGYDYSNETGNVKYSYKLKDAPDEEYETFTADVVPTLAAGEYKLKVEFSAANYPGYQDATLTRDFKVNLRTLDINKVTVEMPESFKASDALPTPSVTFAEDLTPAYDGDQSAITYTYQGGEMTEPAPYDPAAENTFAVGTYTLYANIPESATYAAAVVSKEFNVTEADKDIEAEITFNNTITVGGEGYSLSVKVTEPESYDGTITYWIKGPDDTDFKAYTRDDVEDLKAGTYDIEIRFPAVDGYKAKIEPLTLTINKKTLDVHVTPFTFQEDGALPTPTVTGADGYDGEISYEYTNNVTQESGAYVPGEANTLPVGDYTLTATFPETDVYEANAAGCDFTVTALPEIEATVTMRDVVYGTSSYGLGVKVTNPSSGTVGKTYFIKADVEGSDYVEGITNQIGSLPVGDYVLKVELTAEGYAKTIKEVPFKITPMELDNTKVTVAATDSFVYDAQAHEAEITSVTITGKDTPLVAGQDYEVTSESVTNVSDSGSYTITFKGNYTGAATGEVKMTAAELDDNMVSAIASQTYTGSAIEPALTVTAGTLDLVKDTDYTVEYVNNTNVGTATATLTGMGNFAGTAQADFEIVPVINQNATVTLSETTSVFDGTAKKPTVTVKDGETVVPASEYEVCYYKDGSRVDEMKNVGVYEVRVLDIAGGNYIVGGKAEYSITKGTITPAVSVEGWTYGETAKDPVVTGNTGNGKETYTYYTSADATVSDIKTAKPGSYYVVVTIAESDNCAGGTATSDAFEIAKANAGLKVAVDGKFAESGDSAGAGLNGSIILTPSASVTADSISFACTSESSGSIVEVKENGDGTYTLDAKAPGTDTVTVKLTDSEGCYNEETWTITVTVEEGESGLTVDTAISMDYGDTQALNVTAVGGTVSYEVADESIVSIDNGTIKALKAGETTITVSLTPEAGHAAVDPVTVTVTVAARTIDVTAKSYTITEGDPIPALEWTATNTVSGDEPELTAVIDGHAVGSTPSAGEYDITIDSTSLDTTKYALGTVTNGKLTVNEAPVTTTELTENDVTVETAALTYNGQAQSVQITQVALKESGAVLGSDSYELANSDSITNVGETGSYTISFKGAYTGSVNGTFTVSARALSEEMVSAIPNQTYTGSAIEPTLNISFTEGDNTVTLDKGTDYDVVFSNNINIGTAKAVITGKGNYTGEVSASFSIGTLIDLNAVVELSPASASYDGTAQTPGVTVKSGDTVIPASAYEVYYRDANNKVVQEMTDAGTYTVNIMANSSGVSNYFVTGSAQFTITPAAINPEVSVEDWTYGETPNEPVVTGNDGNGKVAYIYKNANDEIVSDIASAAPGEYHVTANIEASGNYLSGTAEGDFDIFKATAGLQVKVDGELADTDGAAATELTGSLVLTPSVSVVGYDNFTYSCHVLGEVLDIQKQQDGSYKLVALKAGTETATVSVTDSEGYYVDESWTISVTVNKAQGKLVVGKTELNMVYGDSQAIDFVAAEGGTAKYQVASSGVISVEDGKITALKAGTAEVVISLNPDENHDNTTVLPVIVTVNVAPRPIKVNISSYTLNYGDEIEALDLTAENVIEGDPAMVYPTVEGGWKIGDTPDAGVYAITLDDSSLDAEHYVLDEVTTGTLTVNKAKITVAATAGQTAVYGEDIPASFDYEYVGQFAGKDTALKGITLTRASDAIDVGEYDLVFNEAATNAANPNYQISYSTSNKFTITPKAITVIADNKEIFYGTEAPAFTYTVAPVLGSKLATPDVTLSCEVETGAKDAAVGTYDIVVTTGTNPNYDITVQKGVLTVLSTDIGGDYTVALDSDTYTYDGSQKCPVVTLTIDGTSVVIDPDEYTVTYKNNTNAGDAYVVIKDKEGGNISLTGKDYKFVIQKAVEDEAEVHIANWSVGETPETPVVTGVKQPDPSITYSYGTENGDVPTEPGVYTVYATIAEADNYKAAELQAEFTIWGVAAIETQSSVEAVYGDDAIDLNDCIDEKSPETGTLSFESTDTNVVTVDANGVMTIVGAGEAAIKIGMITNDPAYLDIEPAEMITVKVAPKPVTVTVDAGQSKTFGDVDPIFTYTVTDANNHEIDDEVSVTITRTAGDAVGSYDFNAEQILGANRNYAITFNTDAKFTITPKAVTPVITLYNDSFTYDGEAKTPGYHVSVDSTILGETQYQAAFSNNINAGTASLTVSAVEGGNYSFEPVVADFTIAKASITPRVEMGGWTYGEYDIAVNIPETFGNPGSGEVTITIKNANDKVIENLAEAGVGVYTVTAEIAETENYEGGSCQTTFNIVRATPELVVTTTNAFTYGDGSFELDIETNSNAEPEITSSDENVLSVGEGGRINITGAGTATLTVTVKQTQYYKAASVSVDITIAKKNGVLTVSNVAYNVTYGDAPFTIGEITQEPASVIDFKSSDTNVVTVSEEGVVSIVGAGEAIITLTLPGSNNYFGKTADVAINVAKAEATVTAIDASKTYGEDDPALSYSIDGLVYEDEDDVLGVSVTRAAGDNVGQYEITPSFVANPNYDVTIVKGTLTIEPKVLDSTNISLSGYSFTYNGKEQKPEVTVTDPRTEAKVPVGEYSVAYTGDLTNVGSYTVFVSDNDAGNYTVDGYASYSIAKADISPAVEIYGWTYGASTNEPVITGNEGSVIPTIVYTTDVGGMVDKIATADAGKYKVTVTIPESPNYNGGQASAVFEIAKADSDLKVEAVSDKTYQDDTSFALVATTNSDGAVTFSSNNTGILSVNDKGEVSVNAAGTATLTIAVAEGKNYKAGSKELTITVAKKQATLEITNMKYAVTYGDEAFSIADVTSTGENAPTFTSSNPSVVTVNNKGVVTIVGVGEATIAVDVAESNNFLGAAKNVTVKVAPKKITVTANAQSKIYGEADPELTYKLSSELVNEDDLLIAMGRAAGNSAGNYVITPSVSKNANYDVSIETGVFTIEPKTVANPIIILESYEYIADGTAKEPTVQVYDGDVLVPASAYSVVYEDNTENGVASVYVTNVLGGNYVISGVRFFNLYLRGDVNDDGKVDYVDDVYLCRYLANWDGYYPNMLAADIMSDGAVDYADEIYLARSLAGWSGYEL